MKKFWIVFAIVAVLAGTGFGFLWYSVSQLDKGITVDGGVLVWEVGGGYPEEMDSSFFGQLRSSGDLTISQVLFSLHRAAKDDRITALVMDLRGLSADWAKVEETRRAIEDFKAAGKPVYAYFDGASTREYALAVLADKVVMSPEANLMILGVTAELDFMKETLGKLGMEADFIHVGKYKSAPERMTRDKASDANREMIKAIVDDRYEAIVAMLATGRGVSPSDVGGWMDRGMFDAASAMAEGLIDTTGYFDSLMDAEFGDESQTYLADYAYAARPSGKTTHTVGLIYATGVIMPGPSRFDNFQGKIAGSTTVCDELKSVGEDDGVDAVILRIDSPGGSAMASDLIWNQIRLVQEKKPVIVSMSGMAASGGYYIACLADSIFADPSTLTGSIGVYAGKMNRTEMYRKIGVNREFITRGESALLFHDEGGFSPAQRTLFQGHLDSFYERFLAKVADGRNLTRDQVHAVAQGRVWTGSQGLEAGLVDELGGLRRALDSAKWMLGLDPSQKVGVATFGEDLTALERMLLNSLRDGGLFGQILTALPTGGVAWSPSSGPAGVALPLLMDTLRQDGTLAAVALMDGRPVAMAPYWLHLD